MKQKITFFAVSVLLFIVVFYHQGVGINLGIFSILIFVMSYYIQRDKGGVNKDYTIALSGGILSSCSYAYFQDFTSFIVLLFSWHWVSMLMFDPKLQLIKGILLIPLNYFMALPNVVTIEWGFSNKQVDKLWQKSVAYVILPLLISIAFIAVYAFASSTLSNLFGNISFDFNIDVATLFWLIILGTILMFAFWFFEIPKEWNFHKELPSNFHQDLNSKKSLEMVIKSGEITFVMLNIILLLFIAIYGYENFFQEEVIASISQNVHERVYAVIASTAMAVILILIIFRKDLNFNEQNSKVKKLTFSWILLNMTLIFIAIIKNGQYVHMLGLTQKRLGVFAFLILSLIGLFYTFSKVKKVKTNWYLVHKMSYTFYFTLLFIAVVNWSWVITKYNISTDKLKLDVGYHTYSLKYNDVLMYNYFQLKGNEIKLKRIEQKLDSQPLLSDFDGELYDAYVKYCISKKMVE